MRNSGIIAAEAPSMTMPRKTDGHTVAVRGKNVENLLRERESEREREREIGAF
jgi:hypothetical protein